MENIGNNKKTGVALLLLTGLLLLSACRNKSEEPEAGLTVEQQENEIFEDEKQQEKDGYLREQEISQGTDKQDAGTDAGENEADQEESENMEAVLEKYTYRGDAVLTKENFRETIKTYLCIRSSAGLYKLEDLPLTEDFFKESIEHFPYIKSDLSKMKEFYVTFWGVGEDNKMICLCEVRYNTSYPYKRDCYYIEMEMENDQINSMEITLVEKYKANS